MCLGRSNELGFRAVCPSFSRMKSIGTGSRREMAFASWLRRSRPRVFANLDGNSRKKFEQFGTRYLRQCFRCLAGRELVVGFGVTRGTVQYSGLPYRGQVPTRAPAKRLQLVPRTPAPIRPPSPGPSDARPSIILCTATTRSNFTQLSSHRQCV
ncbi:hypothetical protein VTG60DRAFT_3822 [Thermothelomyces hinnuleus]